MVGLASISVMCDHLNLSASSTSLDHNISLCLILRSYAYFPLSRCEYVLAQNNHHAELLIPDYAYYTLYVYITSNQFLIKKVPKVGLRISS